jgi:HAD superfamily hydrolase (TIGR01509 family)
VSPPLTPAAVLFDMDGLLIDSEPLWTVAEEELARDLGGSWDEQLKAQIVGTRLETAVPMILRHYGVPADETTVASTSARLLARMVELFADRLVLLPGAQELLLALHGAGVPTALVSSSYRRLVDALLGQGVGPFALSVAGDEVVHGKPHPEPYLVACQRLGVDPADCVVLEDSPSGVASGEAAGCAVVAVPSVAGVALESRARRLVLPSLATVDVATLGALARRGRPAPGTDLRCHASREPAAPRPGH